MSRNIEEWEKLEEEAREIRRREADWEFIESQNPKVRAALKFYIETGDIRLASKIADMNIEEFRELLRSAKIPVIV